MDEYQKQLFEEGRNQSGMGDKAVGAMIALLFTASVAVWKWVPGGVDPATQHWLWACWALLGATGLTVVVAHSLSESAIDQALADDATGIEGALEPGGWLSRAVTWCDRLRFVFLALGLGAFLWFAWVNVGSHGSNETPKASEPSAGAVD